MSAEQNKRDLEKLAETGKIHGGLHVEQVEFLTGLEIDDFTTCEEVQEAAEGRLALLRSVGR